MSIGIASAESRSFGRQGSFDTAVRYERPERRDRPLRSGW